jgi:tetratricopeptide (TPR) repeat protein
MHKFIVFILGLFLFGACSSNKSAHIAVVPNASDSSLLYTKVHPLYRLDTMLLNRGADPNLLFLRARKRLFYGDAVGAMEDMKRLQKVDSSNAAYFILLSDIYLKLAVKTSCSDAQLILDKAAKIDSNNLDVLIKKAKITFICKPEFKSHLISFELLNKALKKNEQLPEAYFWKGMIYLEEKNTRLAISSFQTAIEVDPSYYEAYMQLGQIYGGALKDTLQDNASKLIAIGYLSNAIKIDSFNDEALYARALLYQNVQRWTDAQIDYNRILKVYPKQLDALYNRGVCYYASNQWKNAEKDFSSILQLDSLYAPALKARAMTYEELGDIFNAASDYRKVLNQYPNEPDALAGLGRMKSK